MNEGPRGRLEDEKRGCRELLDCPKAKRRVDSGLEEGASDASATRATTSFGNSKFEIRRGTLQLCAKQAQCAARARRP